MMTVVDHVRPWFTEQHVGENDPSPRRGPHRQQRHRHADQPAGHEHRLASDRSDRVPAKKLVAAFTAPKATMKVSADVYAVSPKTFFAKSGRTVRSWPIIPPTKRAHGDEQRELREIGA